LPFYRSFIVEYLSRFLMVGHQTNLALELKTRIMKTIIITALILISAVCCQAQDKLPAANGFWVVESNMNQPKTQTIRFYNDDAKLLYTETINTKLNLRREKVKLALNQLCSKLQENKGYLDNRNIIALAFNLKR
jgi:hypothetical protein